MVKISVKISTQESEKCYGPFPNQVAAHDFLIDRDGWEYSNKLCAYFNAKLGLWATIVDYVSELNPPEELP